jgi:single-stranded DNA-binding protein
MSGIEAAFFGALGRDAEAKTSTKGKSYLRFNVRVGEGEGAQWLNVTCFDTSAIEAVDKFTKGSAIYCEGRLSLDRWTGQDGDARSRLSVMSWHSRLSEIGRNRPRKRTRRTGNAPALVPAGGDFGAPAPAAPGQARADFDDEIPW